MTYISFEEFLAEMETTFQSYADTNDLDKISIKGWVIDRLRIFGKNICQQREAVIGIKNSRALLSETFKSLSMALKIQEIKDKDSVDYREIPFKKYITHDVVWDSLAQEYIKDNCQSQEVIESLLISREPIEKYTQVEPLSLIKGMQSDTIDINCYNLNPLIRDTYPNKISITNRTLNTNFKTGLVYLQYNALPSDENGEIVIPIISTGHIKEYIENFVKIKIAESLGINNKNAENLKYWMSMWIQQNRQFEIQARSEANWSGLKKDWEKEFYAKKMENLNRFNLPRY